MQVRRGGFSDKKHLFYSLSSPSKAMQEFSFEIDTN